MPTQFADTDTEVIKEAVSTPADEYVIPYLIRFQFRGVLMNNIKNGATYVLAEHEAKIWFRDNYGIPYDAWNYRETKAAIKSRNRILLGMGIVVNG